MNFRDRFIALCWTVSVMFSAPVWAQAQWTGAVDDNWHTAGNWEGGVVPGGLGASAVLDTMALNATVIRDSNVAGLLSLVIGQSESAMLTLTDGRSLAAGTLTIGQSGEGILNLVAGGFTNSNITLAQHVGSTGILNIGTGGAAGLYFNPSFPTTRPTLTGGSGNAIVNFNHTDLDHNFIANLTGNLSVNHIGSGTTIFDGNKAYTGSTTVDAGMLVLNGNLTQASNTVTVRDAGTLAARGSGRSIAGNVNVEAGGTLITADDMGERGAVTLNIGGNLTLFDHSVLHIGLGAPDDAEPDASVGDRIIVGGNLTLAGTLQISNIGGLDVGRYTIFEYGGFADDQGMAVAGGALQIEAGRVVLEVGGALGDIAWWMGGDGIWNNDIGNESWTSNPDPEAGDPDPPVTAPWHGLIARFQNDNVNGIEGGTVTVTETVEFTELQFVDSGFVIEADGSGVLRVHDDGSALHANTGATGIIAAGIAGDGGVNKTGAGTVVLTGDNTWTGGTTISGGTLRVGDEEGESGTLPGNVHISSGRLVFSRDNYTYGGVISGGGLGVRQLGGGRTVFTGEHTYSGLTDIVDGTLQIGTGGTAGSLGSGSNIAIGASGVLEFNRSDDWGLPNTISGQGRLIQAGSGVLTLEGDLDGFNGDVRVAAGTLRFLGPVSLSGMTILGGATLSLRTVGDTASGNGDPTLTVDGDLLLESGSALRLGVNRFGDVDWIYVTGAADIGGDVLVIEAGDVGAIWPSINEYVILLADGGVQGEFGDVMNTFAFLDASLTHHANHVTLNLDRNDTRFGGLAGLTANQASAGRGLEGVAAMNIEHPLVELVIPLAAADVPEIFDSLSGEVHASLRGMMLEDGRFIRDAAMTQATSGVRNGAWLRLLGHDGHVKDKANTSRLNRTTVGLLVGSDYPVGDGALGAGWVAGYHRSSAKVDGLMSRGDVDSVHGAVYGGGRWDAPFAMPGLRREASVGVRMGAGYSWHQVDVERQSFTGEGLSSDYDANTLQVFGEADYRSAVGDAEIAPFIGVSWARLSTDGFVEGDHQTPVGGTTALRASSQSQNLGLSTLGVRTRASGGPLSAEMMLGWRYAFTGRDPKANLAFLDGGGAEFEVGGAPLSRSAAVIDLGMGYAIGNARLGLSYGGQIGKDARDHALRANLHITLP